MEFQEESVDLTKEIIDKVINILFNIIPLISTSKTLKNLLTSKINNVFKCFLEKFKMTFSQLTYILWIMIELNKILPSIYYLQDITSYTILSYLYESFIISFKYLFDENISIKLFSYYINPHLGQLFTNELTVLKILGFNLYMTEEQFNEYKNKLIYLLFSFHLLIKLLLLLLLLSLINIHIFSLISSGSIYSGIGVSFEIVSGINPDFISYFINSINKDL
jgi:hypothetical protein